MSLIDILDDAAKRQTIMSETGDTRIFGVMPGIVTDNYHKDFPGCVCVQIPVRDQEADVLKWVKVASPYWGKEWGQYFFPEKGDQVLLAFEGGNIEKPYVIGSIPMEKDPFLKKSADEKNRKKRIVTRHGSEIAFFDHPEGEGEKDVIEIHTAGQAHEIVLDNEKKKITIRDKEENCRAEFSTEKGKMEIYAAKRLTLKVGDSIQIKMNGDNGSVSIEANKMAVEASNKLECKTDGTAKMSGQQVIADAGSILKLESSGMVNVSGSPIKLG